MQQQTAISTIKHYSVILQLLQKSIFLRMVKLVLDVEHSLTRNEGSYMMELHQCMSTGSGIRV